MLPADFKQKKIQRNREGLWEGKILKSPFKNYREKETTRKVSKGRTATDPCLKCCN